MRLISRIAAGVVMVGLAVTMAIAQNDAAPSQTYKVDPAHSSIVFKIKHMGISFVYGKFDKMSGQFVTSDKDVLESVTVEVEAASIDTGVERRDNHLRSKDFFDVEKHPTIRFVSSAVKGDGEGGYDVAGNVTLLGVTKPAQVKVRPIGKTTDQRGNVKAGCEATFTIKRSEHGMTYGTANGAIGDEVMLMTAFEGTKQ